MGMAQRKQLTWTDLRVGVFVVVALLIIMVGIFYVTGAGSFGPKYHLITYLPEVDELQTGAPVTLDGIEVGSVESLRLTPNPPDHLHNITLGLSIGKKFEDQIRTDSSATLVTAGLLGDRYVTITRGITGTVIPPGGEVPQSNVPGMKEAVQRGSDLMTKLSSLSDELTGVVGQIRNGNGTLAKLLNDPQLYNHLDSTVGKLDSVVTSIQQGHGSIGKLVASDEMYNKFDDVLSAVHDQKGTVGKLVYDPSAYNSIKSLADNGNAVIGDVRAGKGTLGKLATDDTLYSNMREATANVRDATAKMNSNQGTMGKMFTDPALYDNMTGLTGDLRLLIGDFRQNPKKFLHIKIGLF
jgi:phospholipid/cholesterol/gamma-HCH transport system substrate-binding protein